MPGPVLAPPLGQGLHTVAGQPLGQYLTDQHFIFQYLLFFNLLESKVLHAVTKKKISFVSLLKKCPPFRGWFKFFVLYKLSSKATSMLYKFEISEFCESRSAWIL